MRPLLIATKNQHKVQEYRELLGDVPFQLKSLDDVGISEDVDETGTTFEANARLKADHYAQLSGLLTLADDSGIQIDALNGEPGVHSRRWAGDVSDHERNLALLQRVRDVQDSGRGAHFRCAIAIAEPGRETVVVEGHCDGRLAWEPHGENGFGYDPLFFFPEFGKTLAEVPLAVKNQVSHRARAARAARAVLEERS